MSFNLLFEMAAAIGTQRMVELCEHYLWVTDTQRRDESLREMLDNSGAVIPPAWRDCSGSLLDRGSRWSDCSGAAAGSGSTVPVTPERGPSPLICPGAPRRPVFQSPLMRTMTLVAESVPPFPGLGEATPPGSPRPAEPAPRVGDAVADRLADEGLKQEVLRRLENRDFSLGWTRPLLLEELRRLDPLHPLLCSLHNSSAPGGPLLGYTRNSSGNYATFAPPCIGCSIGMTE